jgi:zinc transport system permease protein
MLALSYAFIQKALICGILIALSSSILGVFLVLRKLSLVSDGLSHVSFAAIALALVLGLNPLMISIPLVMLAASLIVFMSEKAYIYTDSAIGLIASISIAAGVMIISISGGLNLDVYGYLFGSILAVTYLEIIFAAVLAVLVVTIVIFQKNEWLLITFDSDFARIKKINVIFNNTVFTLIQSLVIVVGIKIVGALLMASLIIFPAVTALQISKSFNKMFVFSACISIASVIAGIFLSFSFNAPTGSLIVCVNAVIFVIFYIINKIFKIK